MADGDTGGLPPSWPVIGREPELARIADARMAGARAVLIEAQPGVGKTRLAREALARAEADGAHSAWAQATRSSAAAPLGAFAGVIPIDFRSDNQFELLRGGTQAIRELAGERQLVLGVDDAQLLDATSAALVLHLAATAAAFIVATMRSDQPCEDAIVSLWKDLEAPRLELSQLDEADTEQLLAAMLDGPVEQRVGSWIWETSDGNPLYVRELVLGAVASGALQWQDGLWRMCSPLPISNSLAEMVSARFDGTSEAERETLELLAVGGPLPMRELLELVGDGPLSGIEERGVIAIEGSGARAEVRLAHPLYGEAVRARLGEVRGRRARLRLAEAAQARGPLVGEHALRVARWLLDAGERVPVGPVLDAARAANLSGDPELGERLAQQALDAGAGVEAALVLARSHAIRNQAARAEQILAAAESSITTQDAAGAYLAQTMSVLHSGAMEIDALEELLGRWGKSWPDDERWRARLAAWQLWVPKSATVDGRNEILSRASALIDDQGLDYGERRRLEAVQLIALYANGRGREAHELVCRIRHPPPLRDAIDEVILSAYVDAAVDAGESLDELERWARVTLKEAVAVGDRGAAGLASLALAHRRLVAGQFVDADRWLAEAQLHQEQHDPLGLLAMTFSLQGWRAAWTRDGAAADAALARCHELAQAGDPHGVRSRALQATTAWAAIAHGLSTPARRLLLDAAAEHRRLPLFAGRLLHEAMRAGEPASNVAASLAELNERADARMLAARAAHATHLAESDGPGLLDTAARFEAIGARLYASEAAAHAAQCFLEAGRRDSARRAAVQSRELFIAGQGRPMPSIDALQRGAAGLTRRESELVELARLGLSNGEIAVRLRLSKRTVESHLYRAMQKLGVSDRRELLV